MEEKNVRMCLRAVEQKELLKVQTRGTSSLKTTWVAFCDTILPDSRLNHITAKVSLLCMGSEQPRQTDAGILTWEKFIILRQNSQARVSLVCVYVWACVCVCV